MADYTRHEFEEVARAWLDWLGNVEVPVSEWARIYLEGEPNQRMLYETGPSLYNLWQRP